MDAYERLGMRRCAAPDEEAIRAAYREAAGASHPDHAADEESRGERTGILAGLSEARSILLSPARRLRHLLSLEFPDFRLPGMAPMDDELTRLFSLTGEVLREAEAVAVRKREATTFLAKAAITSGVLDVQERLESVQSRIDAAMRALEADLLRYDREGHADPGTLAGLAQRAAFLEKWRGTLQAAYASLI